MPAPLGAGMRRTETEPHLPVSLVGIVCGSPILPPQYPRRTGTMFSFARIIEPWMECATSLHALTPRPMWPLESPTTTKALNRMRWPALVCFCTGMIFITSSVSAGPRKCFRQSGTP